MYVYGLVLVALGLATSALGDRSAQVPMGTNGLVSPDDEALIQRWPENRLRRYLALRGKYSGFPAPYESELLSHVRAALYTPTMPSLDTLLADCRDLTVDQLVYWAVHFSDRQVGSDDANIFDASPTQAGSKEKRKALLGLCQAAFDDRTSKYVKIERDVMIKGDRLVSHLDGYREACRPFAYQLALAEVAPHVFEPDVNPIVGRVANHSIYDLRDLLDMFGGGWSETDSRERLTELAKAHTALWIGRKPPSSELIPLVRDALYTPIVLSSYPPSIYCEDLTVDQLVYWATHFSAYRANPHGTNIFDASPTHAQSQAKRELAVELCKTAHDERIPKLDLREPELSVGKTYERIAMYEGQRRIFFSELILAEAAPHVFEPEMNYAVGRVAKHSIYDLRDLIDMFGGGWSEEDSHARLMELAKAHTALWIGQRP
ncbi:hypothetical protein RhiJN_23814 [Ceratobasidium sp. AG-Ba]|nr:hypothetical protein RhiJN_23814 [Ceratobasidium sp. AG-Ba]